MGPSFRSGDWSGVGVRTKETFVAFLAQVFVPVGPLESRSQVHSKLRLSLDVPLLQKNVRVIRERSGYVPEKRLRP